MNKTIKIVVSRHIVPLLLFRLTFSACEKPILDETTGEVVPSEANVVLRFTLYEWTEQREPFELARKWPSRDGQRRSQQEAFSVGSGSVAATRAATDITELCSRLNIAIFDGEGTKVKTVAQKRRRRQLRNGGTQPGDWDVSVGGNCT